MITRTVSLAFMASVYQNLLLSAYSESIPPPSLPPPFCGENEVSSPCYNNYCVKGLCDEKDPEPGCKFGGQCQEGCVCSEGYLRAQNGTCVPGDQCPKPIVCSENEVYNNCVNGGCYKRNCSDEGRAILCIDLIAGACQEGCMCQDGYLRAKNGTCVPIKDCPKEEVCSNPHEYYEPCTPSCPSRDCRYYDTETECAQQPGIGDFPCYGSCRCEEGFYKNYNQDCVPKEICSKFCSGLNEFLEAYPKTCEAQTCDTINDLIDITQTCSYECRCYPGYVRNKNGVCIEKENCDKISGH